LSRATAMLLFAGRADHGTDGGPRWAPRTRSGRADEGAARSGSSSRSKPHLVTDRSHEATWRGHEQGCWQSKRLWIGCAKERYAARKRGLRWCWLETCHQCPHYGGSRCVHRSRSSAEVERRGQGAGRCGDRGEGRLGLFSSPTPWIVAAAVVWLATSVAKTIIPKRKKYSWCRRVNRRSNFGRRMTNASGDARQRSWGTGDDDARRHNDKPCRFGCQDLAQQKKQDARAAAISQSVDDLDKRVDTLLSQSETVIDDKGP
jgi:hypothetical protein